VQAITWHVIDAIQPGRNHGGSFNPIASRSPPCPFCPPPRSCVPSSGSMLPPACCSPPCTWR